MRARPTIHASQVLSAKNQVVFVEIHGRVFVASKPKGKTNMRHTADYLHCSASGLMASLVYMHIALLSYHFILFLFSDAPLRDN
jgi:hypothetical protein